MRSTGQKVPHSNQRTSSSLKESDFTSPPMKPPMSEIHQAMPDRPMLMPACRFSRMARKVEQTSPDQTSVPYFWEPAHAQRVRFMISLSPSRRMPS